MGANEGYYGECKLEVDLSTPGYARLDHNLLKGLFGKFNPSRGDLVFTRNGDLAGVMANGSYCLLLRNFDSAATFQFGSDVRDQHTGHTLARCTPPSSDCRSNYSSGVGRRYHPRSISSSSINDLSDVPERPESKRL